MQLMSLIARSIAAAAIAASSVAHAGPLGMTSRGSVSISVTIPPHMVAHEISEDADPFSPRTGLQPRQFCIASKGIETYSVTLSRVPIAGNRKESGQSGAASRIHISWSDGHTAARLRPGSTVSGFKTTAHGCDSEVGPATLNLNAAAVSAQMYAVNGPVTIILAAD